MQTAPAIQSSLPPERHWRAAVIVLVMLLLATTGVWWLSSSAAAPASVGVPLLAGALALAGMAVHLLRQPTHHLRWDGQQWQLVDDRAGTSTPGQLAVALDFGRWMLLRFSQPGWRHRTVWLPASQRTLALHWHAVRCAAYGPPVGASDAAADAGSVASPSLAEGHDERP